MSEQIKVGPSSCCVCGGEYGEHQNWCPQSKPKVSDPDIERIVRDAREQFEKLPPEADISPTAWNDAITASECRTFWIARRAAELAVAEERERCAKIAKGYDRADQHDNARYVAGMIAASIRARKEVGSE